MMAIKRMNYIKISILALLVSCVITTNNLCQVYAQDAANTQTKVSQAQTPITVKPLALVSSPKVYLNKTVIMDAKFDKFSTLGLDYKPAFRSSNDYISFLIKRDDTSFNIPLAEMKLFLKRDMAEKFIDLKNNDEIQMKGVVFSDALGDVWVDVHELKITKKAPEEKKNNE